MGTWVPMGNHGLCTLAPECGGQIIMRVLIVANQTLSSDELVAAAMGRKAKGDCEFHVIVPATPLSKQELALRHSEHPGAVFGESGPVAVARMRLSQGLAKLASFGVTASGDVGDPDPFKAVCIAAAHTPVDEVLVSTLPRRMSRWLAGDLPRRIHRRLGVPVTHVESGRTRGAADHAETERQSSLARHTLSP